MWWHHHMWGPSASLFLFLSLHLPLLVAAYMYTVLPPFIDCTEKIMYCPFQRPIKLLFYIIYNFNPQSGQLAKYIRGNNLRMWSDQVVSYLHCMMSVVKVICHREHVEAPTVHITSDVIWDAHNQGNTPTMTSAIIILSTHDSCFEPSQHVSNSERM